MNSKYLVKKAVALSLLTASAAMANDAAPSEYKPVELKGLPSAPPEKPRGTVAVRLQGDGDFGSRKDSLREKQRKSKLEDEAAAAAALAPPSIAAAVQRTAPPTLEDSPLEGENNIEQESPSVDAQAPAPEQTPEVPSARPVRAEPSMPDPRLPPSVLKPGEPVPVYPTMAHAAQAGVDPFKEEPTPSPPVGPEPTSEAPAAEDLPSVLPDIRAVSQDIISPGMLLLLKALGGAIAVLLLVFKVLPRLIPKRVVKETE